MQKRYSDIFLGMIKVWFQNACTFISIYRKKSGNIWSKPLNFDHYCGDLLSFLKNQKINIYNMHERCYNNKL